ncbi:hypothetical protein CTI12_AA098050 [Artemisia annua]|uniref:F-box domain-containing protein n=1 Tax=Artemisia annua TaxID=35608 RepID=A0A2U1PYB0_ARTAN|nr:hypothetical protein CTI12_AA098050 [Artemisia annua]
MVVQYVTKENLGADEDSSRDQYYYTLHDPLTKYQCQIPELLGRRFRGYYHGWVILSDHLQNVMWSLWNPVTSKMIHFPPLILKDGDAVYISECCLSAPLDDPSSVLLLTRKIKPGLVFFRLEGKRKELRWNEMSLKRLTGQDGGSIGEYPSHSLTFCDTVTYFLKGRGTELLCINVGFCKKRIEAVYFFKLNMASVNSEDLERFKSLDMSCKTWDDMENMEAIFHNSMRLWEQLFDLKDAIFFVDLGGDKLGYYRPGIASEMGGYIHIRDEIDKILYSYNVKENTIFLSSMPSLVLPTTEVSLWECRLENDHGGAKCTLDSKQEENQIVVRSVTDDEIGLNEWNLLNHPFDILEMIMEHCGCVEYLNFRATCKRCEVAAPLIQWSNKTLLRRLQTYSLVSPWLVVVDENQGIITFTDPMLGDKYFMKNLHVSLAYQNFFCSRFGWLLFFSSDFEFESPPTSPDCMVVGFARSVVLIHYVARESPWLTICAGADYPVFFPTFLGKDLYALGSDGKLIGFKALGEEVYSLAIVEARSPISCCTSPARYYLMKCDKDLLKVIVGKFGERVEVFKSDVSKQEWEKIDSLGNHMIYICGTTCLCIEAETREMENKIYFPLLHSKNRKIVFYSLETCTYQTFSGENIQQHFKDFIGTAYHLYPHAWIEPSWS